MSLRSSLSVVVSPAGVLHFMSALTAWGRADGHRGKTRRSGYPSRVLHTRTRHYPTLTYLLARGPTCFTNAFDILGKILQNGVFLD
jgi:hypothetical protein